MTTYAWGAGSSGQLGQGTSSVARSSPVAVVGGHTFVEVDCAAPTSIGLKGDGSAWTWGGGTNGALGDNTTTSKSSPVAVVGNHSFIHVSMGGENTGNSAVGFGLKADGSAWGWGRNTSGQLGDNTLTDKSSPVAVVGNHSFVALHTSKGTSSGGAGHTMGLKADGSVWCWGVGTNGVLGNQATTTKSSPVAVVGNHSFIAISAGVQFCMALKADGSVWTWGANASFGELGDNTTTAKSSPVAVVGNHSFIAIGAACVSAFGLKADGSIWSWGGDDLGGTNDGILGHNTNNTHKSSPVAVVGNHSFVTLVVGSIGAAGIKADGSIWGWGRNTSGEIGDQTATNRSSPVLVVGGITFVAGARGDTHSVGTTDQAQAAATIVSRRTFGPRVGSRQV